MTRPTGRVSVVIATTALVVAIAALVVALTRNPGHPRIAVVRETATTVTSTSVSVPPVGTLTFDGTGRPTLQLSGYVRIPITHAGSYTWTSRLIAAPSSVLSLGGNPDAGSEGYRVVGTAAVRSFRSTWVGDFPKGHMIGERVTFQVESFSGRPFVELSGGTISGAPLTSTTAAS